MIVRIFVVKQKQQQQNVKYQYNKMQCTLTVKMVKWIGMKAEKENEWISKKNVVKNIFCWILLFLLHYAFIASTHSSMLCFMDILLHCCCTRKLNSIEYILNKIDFVEFFLLFCVNNSNRGKVKCGFRMTVATSQHHSCICEWFNNAMEIDDNFIPSIYRQLLNSSSE